jgi:hypothetical protein
MEIHLDVRAHLPLVEFIKHELAPAPQLPRCVCTTREAADDLVGDPTGQRHTCSQLQRASSRLAKVSKNCDLETFVEASDHLYWDTTMNEEYCSLMVNDTWDLVCHGPSLLTSLEGGRISLRGLPVGYSPKEREPWG